jgi:hypothetical protein
MNSETPAVPDDVAALKAALVVERERLATRRAGNDGDRGLAAR